MLKQIKKDTLVGSSINDDISIPIEVIKRYAYKNDISLKQAEKLFKKVAIFLDHAYVHKSIPDNEIDLAWHEFILHTMHYHDYCISRFGRFIHHIPTSPTDCNSDDDPDKGCSTGIWIDAPKAIQCSSDCQSCRGCFGVSESI